MASAKRKFFETKVDWAKRVLTSKVADFVIRVEVDSQECTIYTLCNGNYRGNTFIGGKPTKRVTVGTIAISADENWELDTVSAFSRRAGIVDCAFEPMADWVAPFLHAARSVARNLNDGEGVLFITIDGVEWYIKSDSFEPDEIVRLYGPHTEARKYNCAGSMTLSTLDMHSGIFNLHHCNYDNRVLLARLDDTDVPVVAKKAYQIEPDIHGAITCVTAVKPGIYTREKFSLTVDLTNIALPGEIVDLRFPIKEAIQGKWPGRGLQCVPKVDLSKVIFVIRDKQYTMVGLNLFSPGSYFCSTVVSGFEVTDNGKFPTDPY